MLKQITSEGDNQPAEVKVEVSDNARVVLEKRYLRKNRDGRIVETPEQMFRRVAAAIARPEPGYGTSALRRPRNGKTASTTPWPSWSSSLTHRR